MDPSREPPVFARFGRTIVEEKLRGWTGCAPKRLPPGALGDGQLHQPAKPFEDDDDEDESEKEALGGGQRLGRAACLDR